MIRAITTAKLIMIALLWPSLVIPLQASEQQSATVASKEIAPEKNLLYWYRNYDSKATYRALELALQKTQDIYGDFNIVRGPKITQGRAIVELQNNQHSTIRLINAVIDDTREEALIPVRIAADEGLIGLRVCIINAEDRPLFENVRSHKDIFNRGIVFGQGTHWPDTKILRANTFPVITSPYYENLFQMLKRKRFNCFLRGANEAISDLKRQNDNSLIIEPNLLFSYPSFSLFFVSKKDTQLAARLELGLRRALLDGSFSEYFQQYYAKDITALNIEKRRVIRLNNPLLSDETLIKTSIRAITSNGKVEAY